MRVVLAWFASGAVAALLALAISSTLYGNRGDEAGSWTGGTAPWLAFSIGALPLTLGHGLSFLWLRPRDPLSLRMARAAALGLTGFALALGGLMLAARHS